MIQACRGNLTEQDEQIYVADTVPEPKTLPLMTDFLVGYGCEEDYTSFCGATYGSIFIQTICNVFNQHWRRRSLLSMMTMVNSHLANEVTMYKMKTA